MIDATQQVSAVARRLGSRTLEAGEARVSTISRVYPTDLDDLWDACTTAERLARWFAPVSGELRLGGRYQVEGNAGGTVERCAAPDSFAATWEFAGEISWITVSLSAVDAERTRFELEHVAHVKDEFWEQYGPGATGIGWDLGLLGLSLHLSDPSAERVDDEAFAASDEGRQYVRESGEAWYRAAVASGLDEQAQRASADRSIAFYTGATA